MTGQGSSKGNGAAKRMNNKKLQEKRQRSWARGEQRKKRNQEANEARAAANLAMLKELGGSQQNYERVTERYVLDKKTGLTTPKTFIRTKRESPGSALARTRREMEMK